MGKSPGRWIKTVFGKKSSKSNITKEREKLVNKKEAVVASNVSENGLALDPSANDIARNEDLELETREAENLLPGNQEIDTVGSVDQDAIPDPEKIRQEEAATKAQAAFRGYLARRAFRALKGIIRLQALIRGHLVRRQAAATLCCMYRIVKLQAFVRGRRVRHSDVGFEIQEKCNLFNLSICVQNGKLGEPVGISTQIAQLSVNTFIRKLLASTTVKTLHLQYVPGDPNSVLSWFMRWSASQFWKPVPQPKKIRDSKSSRKQGNISIGEAQISKSKRTRKLPTANFEPVPVQAIPEFEKPKRNVRKSSSQPSDPVHENPQSELEKVKRSLRKIHNPVVENAVVSEVECDTPKQHLEKATVTAGHAVSEQGAVTSKEKIKKEAVSGQGIITSNERIKKDAVSEQGVITSNEKIKKEAVSEQGVITSNEKIKKEAVSEQVVITCNEMIKNEETLTITNVPVVEITPRSSVKKELSDIPSSYQVTSESKSLTEATTKDNNATADEAKNEQSDLPETIYKDENSPLINGNLNDKEDQNGNENQKPMRKSSILAKQDRAENGLQNSPTLPSYMAATESAKAKLRAQGPPRFGQDGSERNNLAGRHSLPSSTNSKISSHSPRTQRSVPAGGKGGPRSDKAMPSSRGANGKVIQAEWKR